MLRNPRVLQTRLSHFRSPNLAPPLLHHHHGLQNLSIPAALIHQPFGKRLGLARLSSSKMVRPSEGDDAIGNGMRLHVTKVTEWEVADRVLPEGWATLKPYAKELLWENQSVMAAQSALVTRLCTRPYPTTPEIESLDWELYSIVVQSPMLRRVLESVSRYYSNEIPSYSSIIIASEHVELIAPFKPYLKKRLEDALRKEQDPETKQHLSLLCNTLKGDVSKANKMIKENAAKGIVYFEDLPLMFKPGAILYTLIEGQPQLVRLREWSNWFNWKAKGQQRLDLTCTYVDWGGTRFTYEDAPTEFFIYKFEGPMTITDLPIYPLVYHSLKSEVERALVNRGKKFEAHKGYHYRAYHGIGVNHLYMGDGFFEANETDVNGRVIIDTAAFYQLHPNERQAWFIRPDPPVDRDSKSLRLRSQQREGKGLNEKQLRLCAPSLRAYSVNDKKWLHIMVDGVKDIEWDDQAFGNLALPQEKKEMILAFANSQIKHEHNFEDVVQDKGKGVIVLCGPPGAGKTLTAEAIAEEIHAPLYTLFMGDTGNVLNAMTPEEMELYLVAVLGFVAEWKAVLLLDDPDAFVETRSYYDGQHKNLVPVYQRILEYYDSVLFLNTNLSGGIDNAFESRIHISSQYHGPDLDDPQPARVIEGDVEKLAQTPKTYGRVGDVFKEAQLLATRQKTPMSLEHVKTVTQLRAADAIRNRGAE